MIAQSPTRLRREHHLATCGFLILVTLLCQVCFSPLGFNPTDDGVVMASSRRVLDGQIPHRDFIVARPALPAYLHAPIVLLAGDYTLWVSRLFVWFQFACIAWAWTGILGAFAKRRLGLLETGLVALISVAASANNFPIMAWTTIDGLFLASLGLRLGVSRARRNKALGYLLIGAACLCKQSFWPFAPFSIVVLGDWRNIRNWIALMLPAASYACFLLVTGALPDAFIQLIAREDVLSLTLKAGFLRPEYWVAMAVGALFGWAALSGATPDMPAQPIGRAKLGLIGLLALPLLGVAVFLVTQDYFKSFSWHVFWLATGGAFFMLLKRRTQPAPLLPGLLLALGIAGCVSLSGGIVAPILALGPLLTALIALTFPLAKDAFGRRPAIALLATFMLFILYAFAFGRLNHIYRDLPAASLNASLDGVLPGANRIRTNPTTYRFLAELRDHTRTIAASDKTYSILPDCAGWWIQASQPNPLPIDWAQAGEWGDAALEARLIEALESQRKTNMVIVQKIRARYLFQGVALPTRMSNTVVDYVRRNFTHVRESRYFELYE